MGKYLTILEVAERYGVRPAAVNGWIRNGELSAINVVRSLKCKKPRYRISQKALEEFEALRATVTFRPAERRVQARKPLRDHFAQL